jgi:hypothetical protein
MQKVAKTKTKRSLVSRWWAYTGWHKLLALKYCQRQFWLTFVQQRPKMKLPLFVFWDLSAELREASRAYYCSGDAKELYEDNPTAAISAAKNLMYARILAVSASRERNACR